jgi:hypothetical protein
MIPINLKLDASIRGLLGLSLGTLIGRIDSLARGINARKTQDLDEEDEEELKIHTRSWKPVNSADIWRFIGYLLHMGAHKEARHEKH